MTKEQVAAEFLALQSVYAELKAEEDSEVQPAVLTEQTAEWARRHRCLDAVRQLLEELRAVRDE